MPIIIRGTGMPDPSEGLTATAADIMYGKTAAVDGKVVTGNFIPPFSAASWGLID